MSDIFIVVHANSTWNELGLWQGHCDTELSKTGMIMAERLANHPELSGVKSIYSSDLKRAYQTVEPLAIKLKLDIVKDPFLREGRWSDHSIQKNVSVLPAPYDYEERSELYERARQTLERINRNASHFPILIITHGTFLECFIESIKDCSETSYKGIRSSVNSFDVIDGKWRVNQLNDVSHLPEVTKDMICITKKGN
ncbi:MAG: hypothetical protein GKR93_00085 [Gammaproteobacteria bacterium]|nr:hypothetical protein [Gammaproteobacteria bacterium]